MPEHEEKNVEEEGGAVAVTQPLPPEPETAPEDNAGVPPQAPEEVPELTDASAVAETVDGGTTADAALPSADGEDVDTLQQLDAAVAAAADDPDVIPGAPEVVPADEEPAAPVEPSAVVAEEPDAAIVNAIVEALSVPKAAEQTDKPVEKEVKLDATDAEAAADDASKGLAAVTDDVTSSGSTAKAEDKTSVIETRRKGAAFMAELTKEAVAEVIANHLVALTKGA